MDNYDMSVEHINTRRTKILGIANTVLLSLVSIPTNANVPEEDLVKKAVRMANTLIEEVKNFKLD